MSKRGRPRVKRLETLEGRDEFFKETNKFLNRHLGSKRPFVIFICYEGEEGVVHSHFGKNIDQKTSLGVWKPVLAAFTNAAAKLISEYDFMRGVTARKDLPFEPARQGD